MFKSLYAKLALVLFGLFLALGAAFLIIARFATDQYYQEITQRQSRPIAKYIADSQSLIVDGKVNNTALTELARNAMIINPTIEVYLIDKQGKILAYALPSEVVKRSHVNLGAIRRFLAGHVRFPLPNDDPRDPSRKKVFSAAPIQYKNTLEGYVYIILGGNDYDQLSESLRQSFILKLSLAAIGTSLLFLFLTGLIIFARLTSRLRLLTARVETFQQDNLLTIDAESNQHTLDEIDRLTNSFSIMAQRVGEHFQHLKELDQTRIDLITNVTHDLRTPLATLQGYIETLLMKLDPRDDPEQKALLDVSRKHCLRLAILISELFELAKLDSQNTKLNLESFSIAELIQDVSQEFQFAADKKGINLQVDLQPIHGFVIGDIALIQRVLENLIENALHFTPCGGTVEVVLLEQSKYVKVTVSDTGYGIPDDEIPYIFDRFYCAGNNDSLKKEGTGLGLAIVKRILELHNRNVVVDSTVNAGTSFTFRLSKIGIQ